MKTLYFDSSDMKSTYLQVKHAFADTGAVVLKGLEFDQLTFESFTKYFCQHFFRVTSRKNYRLSTGDGFTTVAPPENFTLLGHSEAQYGPCMKTPNVGFLFSQVAPDKGGGETFLINGATMFNRLSPELQNRFKNENIIYEFLWEPQRWQTQYNVETEAQLHQLFKKSKKIRYTFKNGWLHMFYATPGIIQLKNGTNVFSNGLLAHLPYINHPAYSDKMVFVKKTNQIYWENGEVISTETINHLIDAHDQCKQLHVWENNDLMIFDNVRYLHGREENVEYTQRKILTRFGYFNNNLDIRN